LTTPLERKLSALIGPLLAAEGYDLVQLSLIGDGRARSLQILAEDPKTSTLDLAACTKLSRTIGTHLEVEDVIKGAYRLEISSPGIDRPLVKPADYMRYVGFEIKAETHVPINDQKRYHGKIVTSDDETVTIATDTKTVTLAFADIARARLKLTDGLLKSAKTAADAKAKKEEGEDQNDRTVASC
jgi:ribosome maturation factor RimP